MALLQDPPVPFPPPCSFGTYKLKGTTCYDCTLAALDIGYRSIDTARCYGNESEVGEAIRASGVPRDEIFLTSKIAPAEMGSEADAFTAIELSLQLLQTPYLDLCLIHWPGRAKTDPSNHPENRAARADTWRAMLRAKRLGLCRHIGVSNFSAEHIDELADVAEKSTSDLLKKETDVEVNQRNEAQDLPKKKTAIEVNQIEVHPLYRQEALRQFCARTGVAVQAYSSLGSSVPTSHRALLRHPAVQRVATEAKKSAAQVCLMWAAQQGLPVIPKASSREHMRENWETVAGAVAGGARWKLSEEHMLLLAVLGECKLCWDPKTVL